MANMYIPKQGPMYFPMDKVAVGGEDPNFLLNKGNTNLPLGSTSNLLNSPANSFGALNSPNSATGIPSKDDPEKQKKTRLARILAIILCAASAIIIIIGIANVIYTAAVLGPTNLQCLGTKSPFQSLSPSNGATMVILTWIWVSAGAWAGIPPLVAGAALFMSRRKGKQVAANDYNPGLPTELQNAQNNYTNAPDVYRIFAVFSLIFCLPVGAVLAVIDVLDSTSCDPIIKIIFPIFVLILIILDFVLLLVAWYKANDATDSEYQYIGSTYTVYETYEPVLTKENPVMHANQGCCKNETSSPIVIINQPPTAQMALPPVNVLVRNEERPQRPIMRPMPRPVPFLNPAPVRAVPRPQPVYPIFDRPMPQQRYYPNQMYGPPSGGFLGRPNAYQGMFLPGVGDSGFPYSRR